MKNYAFQFASQRGEVFEDTDLISLEEAKTLWEENYEKAYYNLSNGIGIEMCIWQDMKNDGDYHTKLAYIGNDYIAKDGLIYPPHTTAISKRI